MDNGLFSLAGKVIVVTGGTRKYGFHMCDALASAGGTVILTSREKARAEETANEIGRKGGRVLGYELRLEDDGSIEKFIGDVIADHGKIDVLVNNARRIPQMAAPTINREAGIYSRSFWPTNATGLAPIRAAKSRPKRCLDAIRSLISNTSFPSAARWTTRS